VNLETLKQADVIKQNTVRARIFLSGELNKKVTVSGLAVSDGARKAIEAAGGKVEE
jgi:large subunit ribosomal protein L15